MFPELNHFNTNSKKSLTRRPLMSLLRSPRQSHKMLRSPRQSHKMSRSPRQSHKMLRSPRQSHKMLRSPRPYIPISKKCDHTKNFSCFYSEQTVIVNGKQQHKKQNKCKCYECGTDF